MAKVPSRRTKTIASTVLVSQMAPWVARAAPQFRTSKPVTSILQTPGSSVFTQDPYHLMGSEKDMSRRGIEPSGKAWKHQKPYGR
ncbi:hypothetical protein Kisp02_02370 [Kineosporia sp. NBRC 101731]|nr:hypothetical protein Kisp02_02370 [Kineosporia sp. NBRC 101731]